MNLRRRDALNMRPRRHQPVEPNLTPLIDVVFLLLIFFMVSTTFDRETQIKISLPEAGGEQVADREQDVIELIVDASGNYYLGEFPVINTRLETLRRAIEKQAGEQRDQPFVIRADARAPHQAVMRALEAAGQLGFENITFPAMQRSEDAMPRNEQQ